MISTKSLLAALALVAALGACNSSHDGLSRDAAGPSGGSDAGLGGQTLPGDGAGAGSGTSGTLCAGLACSGATADFCCPGTCTASDDVDCPGCGNGHLEPGETCDPPGTCAQSCAQAGCMKRRLKGAGTCSAICADDGPQTACIGNDGCCPLGCDNNGDSDCAAACGNGLVEAGEACDPKSEKGCPTSCPTLGCARFELRGAGTCQAQCVQVTAETACKDGDGCCAPGCAGLDADCATCGNGVKDPNEACDPLTSCPQSCPAQGCQLRRLVNAGSCAAQCTDSGVQTVCRSGDGCCPSSCDGNGDSDCRAVCGNSKVEPGETCDPPSACDAQRAGCVSTADRRRTPAGSADLCTFRCEETARPCGPADGACPGGCAAATDVDCGGCGNGRIDGGESCDPPGTCLEQQRACVSNDGVVRTPSGDPAACTFRCAEMNRACVANDGICPPGCGPTADPDCAGCGNGKAEAGEACDPIPDCEAAQRACVSDQDSRRAGAGDPKACTFTCTTTPRRCGDGSDDVCPTGCGPTVDEDCPGCGNGRLEAGETCDPPAVCQQRVEACASDADTIRTPGGSAQACTFACMAAARACGPQDGFCPTGCNANADGDCKAFCGNGITEEGETCDTPAACEAQREACDQLKLKSTGDPALCTFRCIRLGAGEVCHAAGQCESGSCVDERCCTVTACGTCQTCRGEGGTCLSVSRVEDDTCNGRSSCVNGACVERAILTITGATYVFPQTSPGSSSFLSFTITNAGTYASGPVSVTIEPPFSVSASTCKELAPGATCSARVAFAPTVWGLTSQGALTASASPGGTTNTTLQGASTPLIIITNPIPIDPIGVAR